MKVVKGRLARRRLVRGTGQMTAVFRSKVADTDDLHSSQEASNVSSLLAASLELCDFDGLLSPPRVESPAKAQLLSLPEEEEEEDSFHSSVSSEEIGRDEELAQLHDNNSSSPNHSSDSSESSFFLNYYDIPKEQMRRTKPSKHKRKVRRQDDRSTRRRRKNPLVAGVGNKKNKSTILRLKCTRDDKILLLQSQIEHLEGKIRHVVESGENKHEQEGEREEEEHPCRVEMSEVFWEDEGTSNCSVCAQVIEEIVLKICGQEGKRLQSSCGKLLSPSKEQLKIKETKKQSINGNKRLLDKNSGKSKQILSDISSKSRNRKEIASKPIGTRDSLPTLIADQSSEKSIAIPTSTNTSTFSDHSSRSEFQKKTSDSAAVLPLDKVKEIPVTVSVASVRKESVVKPFVSIDKKPSIQKIASPKKAHFLNKNADNVTGILKQNSKKEVSAKCSITTKLSEGALSLNSSLLLPTCLSERERVFPKNVEVCSKNKNLIHDSSKNVKGNSKTSNLMNETSKKVNVESKNKKLVHADCSSEEIELSSPKVSKPNLSRSISAPKEAKIDSVNNFKNKEDQLIPLVGEDAPRHDASKLNDFSDSTSKDFGEIDDNACVVLSQKDYAAINEKSKKYLTSNKSNASEEKAQTINPASKITPRKNGITSSVLNGFWSKLLSSEGKQIKKRKIDYLTEHGTKEVDCHHAAKKLNTNASPNLQKKIDFSLMLGDEESSPTENQAVDKEEGEIEKNLNDCRMWGLNKACASSASEISGVFVTKTKTIKKVTTDINIKTTPEVLNILDSAAIKGSEGILGDKPILSCKNTTCSTIIKTMKTLNDHRRPKARISTRTLMDTDLLLKRSSDSNKLNVTKKSSDIKKQKHLKKKSNENSELNRRASRRSCHSDDDDYRSNHSSSSRSSSYRNCKQARSKDNNLNRNSKRSRSTEKYVEKRSYNKSIHSTKSEKKQRSSRSSPSTDNSISIYGPKSSDKINQLPLNDPKRPSSSTKSRRNFSEHDIPRNLNDSSEAYDVKDSTTSDPYGYGDEVRIISQDGGGRKLIAVRDKLKSFNQDEERSIQDKIQQNQASNEDYIVDTDEENDQKMNFYCLQKIIPQLDSGLIKNTKPVDHELMKRSVYMSNLSPRVTEIDLEAIFEPYNIAINAKTNFPHIELFFCQRNHKPRGDGVVVLASPDNAHEAIQELNAKRVKESIMRLRLMDEHTLHILNNQFYDPREYWICINYAAHLQQHIESHTSKEIILKNSIWQTTCHICSKPRIFPPSRADIQPSDWLCPICRTSNRIEGLTCRGCEKKIVVQNRDDLYL